MSTNNELLRGIKTAIFDMDGTIYQLDGDNDGFKNSTLQKIVKANTAEYISKRENISIEEAKIKVNELISNKTHLSSYAIEKYGVSKKDFFDATWNIDPGSIVTNYEEAVTVITELANRNIELILLTQAAQIWQNNVFTFLNLQNIFSEINTGEGYQNKDEIFPIFSKTRHPQTIIAIGDQFETDIKPAQDAGYHTLHISSPKDLLKLLENE